MRKDNIVFGEYFCGNKISDYGLENGRVDYATLAKSFDAVLSNDIVLKTWEVCGEWEQENGFIDNQDEIDELQEKIDELQEKLNALDINDYEDTGIYEDLYEKYTDKISILQNDIEDLEAEQENTPEIFQYFIISDAGASILEDYTNEIVFYNYELDMYVWGVTHYGTSWDYVLTDIQCEKVTKEGEKA